MKRLKVLCVLPSLNLCGGIESFAMNYYRNLDDDICMDFITHNCHDNELYDEIISKGNSVTVLPVFNLKNYRTCLKEIDKFFSAHPDYDIIHCHMANGACFYFKSAKKYGNPLLIIHSHQDNYADTALHALRNIPLIKKGIRLATHRAACTTQAGDFLFGKKTYKTITNAIEPAHYIFDEALRDQVRSSLMLPKDGILLGTVGRLTEQKNPLFLLEILTYLPKNYHLMYVGEGHLTEAVQSKAESLELSDRVHMVGSVSVVSPYFSAMDIFILPSLYEGLGIVNIEAQASGLPTIVSDKVPSDANMGELFTSIPLSSPAKEWADRIKKISSGINPEATHNRKDKKWCDAITNNGYDIKKEAKTLADYYRNIKEE
ncbi:MAG: glycosyltransferase [Lachnospiraceae bacterium]|nr:glycosyltransferase [Lachnospiraceae bacterium]